MGAVFRNIPAQVQSLENLGLGAVFQRIAQLPRGLVLVHRAHRLGQVDHPGGADRSTSISIGASTSSPWKTPSSSSTGLPALINQRQVHRDTHSFSAALRSALRQDPDVILVGELRDLETIRLALTAAETGHLVFGTLHTASAAKTVDRLVDVFPAGEKPMVRSMLSESLQAVVSQVLVEEDRRRARGGP